MRAPLQDWVDKQHRLHRFIGIMDGRAYWRVDIPARQTILVPDLLNGGDSANYASTGGNYDGYIYAEDANWSSARGSTTGTVVVTEVRAGAKCDADGIDSIYRGFITVDTSGLPDGAVISAASLSVYVTNVYAASAWTLYIVPYTGTAQPLSSDYNDFGTADWGNIASGSITASQRNSITMSATGIAGISLTGNTKLGLRSDRDISDGGTPGTSKSEYVRITDGDDGTNYPYLAITYTVPVNVTMTPPATHLTALPQVPAVSLTASYTLTPPAGYLPMAGQTPVIVAAMGVNPAPGLLYLLAPAVDTETSAILAVPTGHGLLFAAVPSVNAGAGVVAPAGMLTLLGLAPTTGTGILITPPAAVPGVLGVAPSSITGVTLTAPAAIMGLVLGGAVHEQPVMPHPVRSIRLRPSHWFSARRDFVRR